MHREERDERLEVLRHSLVGRGELLEVLADLGLLLRGLAQQPLLHDEGDVVAGDAHLREALLHPANGVGSAGEARVVEDRFLDATDEAEASRLADLADLAEHGEVDAQFVVPARREVVEHLVEHEQQTLVAVDGLEGSHHLVEVLLGPGHLRHVRELEVDTEPLQPVAAARW